MGQTFSGLCGGKAGPEHRDQTVKGGGRSESFNLCPFPLLLHFHGSRYCGFGVFESRDD